MKAIGGIVALIIVLGIGMYIYKMEFTQGPMRGAPPKEVIDVAGVKSDLIAIGQAERLYMASHGSYAGLDQLQQDGATVSDGSRRGYNYVVSFDDGQHFTVTAAPTDPAKRDWPTLAIDDTMQVSQH